MGQWHSRLHCILGIHNDLILASEVDRISGNIIGKSDHVLRLDELYEIYYNKEIKKLFFISNEFARKC